MSGKTLKTLADQLWKNHGVSLVPTFDAGIEPGTVLSRKKWNDISRIGHVRSRIGSSELPAITGPTACLLADFKRSHELNADAAIALLGPSTTASGQLRRAVDVVASFDSPVMYSMDLLELEDVIESQGDRFWNAALGQRLGEKDARIVYQTIRGRLSFVFRGSGGIGLDFKSGPLGNLSSAGLKTGWQWRNEATLESKKELLIAVEYAWYDKRKRRFRGNKR